MLIKPVVLFSLICFLSLPEACGVLTLKAPPIICSRRQFKNLLLFQKLQIRHDISWESSAGRRFSCNIIPYFCQKWGKMSQNLSSAAVVIGALRVNAFHANVDNLCKQCEPMSGPMRCWAYSGSKLNDTDDIPERFFSIGLFKKALQMTKKWKITKHSTNQNPPHLHHISSI